MALTPKINPATGKPPLPNLRSGGFVGDACDAAKPCREGLHCAGLFSDGKGAYPQGMCTTICPKGTCPDDPAYPSARCVTWPNEPEPICMVGCNERGSCDRVGYECGRADRADGGDGFRYLCTPRPGSARNALAALRENGTAQNPAGTLKISELAAILRGGPAEFSQNARYSLTSAIVVSPDAPPPPSTEEVVDAMPAPEAALPFEASTSVSPQSETLTPRRETSQDISLVSWAVIGVVSLITLFSILRLVTSSRVSGMFRQLRSSTEDETPLERIRREDREKRRTRAADQAPEVRVSRRLPTRPLRDDSLAPSATRITTPVISREEAEARQLLKAQEEGRAPAPPTPAPAATAPPRPPVEAAAPTPPQTSELYIPEMEPGGGFAEAHASAPETVASSEDSALPPLLGGAGMQSPGFAAASLRKETPGTARVGEPSRPVDWMSPPDPKNPLMDVGRPFVARLWGGARAAKPYGVRRFDRMEDHLPTLIEMDEFVSPLPLEVVVQLLDELLEYAEDLRQKKGYDAVVYVETDPRRTWFRRGPEGKIRLHHAPDAFSKPALATDVMRRKGLDPAMRPQDAHLLSLVHLGRHLLGSAAWDDVVRTLDELASTSTRFSHEETQLLEYLLAPEENEHLKRMADARRKAAGGSRRESVVSSTSLGEPPRASTSAPRMDDESLPCPNCASEIAVGDLACRHCGVALHPRPAFCSACGTRNLLFADGREQPCLNFDCSEPIVHSALQADVEGRRLSIISDLLSSFDEFRKLPTRGGQERYEALQGGRRVEIWQVQSDRGTVITEPMRPEYGLDERVTLPARQSERSGLNFIVYDPPGEARHPLYSIGAEGFAEQLLSLAEMVHDAKLRLPALSTEDLSVSERGEVCLLTGHRLRIATQPCPRVLDSRFVAPELARQVLATERSDLYTVAAIWYFIVVGAHPEDGVDATDALLSVPELVRELMTRALSAEPSDRPESARVMLAQLRRRRRISDLV